MKEKKRIGLAAFACMCVVGLLLSCGGPDEMTLEDTIGFEAIGPAELIALARFQPFRGFDALVPGHVGGIWSSSITSEPRSFNQIAGAGDNTSVTVIGTTLDNLLQYDTTTRSWRGRLAENFWWEINPDGGMDVYYTLREGLYWTYYNSTRREPVTSWDIVFWHNEIEGDQELGMRGYSGQFVEMPDGSQIQRTAHVVDDRTFYIRLARTLSEPFFNTNMSFGPAHHYEPALRQGYDEVTAIFNLSTDPRLIPSIGAYYITEYAPGQRIVFERNPNWWQKDVNGVAALYREQFIYTIVPDQTTQFLMFQQGQMEVLTARPEDVDFMVRNQNDWTTYHNDGSLSSGGLWTFNQNPQNEGEPWYDWFSQTAFRQAMSSMTNMDRLISQAHRGFAGPQSYWFPPANRFHNPEIRHEFTFNPPRAIELLASIGIRQDAQGVMRDSQGRAIEFDIWMPAGVDFWINCALVMQDELATIGISARPVETEFQSMVASLMGTYDWQTLMIGLGGPGVFPNGGTNVYLSNGNLHMWHPNQEGEAYRDWERRKDFLFREGMYTPDDDIARPLWEEFQQIMLYQMPIIWLGRGHAFTSVSNRWDHTNFSYDNFNGGLTNQVFLSQTP
ncbi:MAG: ABC transporter substrate-binding protein [Treponema sp.]|nr:ABC transporter substrate-binding protein [Treponema sp.]